MFMGVVSTEIFAIHPRLGCKKTSRLEMKISGGGWRLGHPLPSNLFMSLRSLVMIANEGKVGEKEVEEVETRPTRPAQL